MSDILENFINQGRFYVNEIPPVTQLAIAVLVSLRNSCGHLWQNVNQT